MKLHLAKLPLRLIIRNTVKKSLKGFFEYES